jgi:hypothetical protein
VSTHVQDRDQNESSTAISQLPPLPSILRYYDSYSDNTLTIRHPEISDQWLLGINGRRTQLDFSGLSEPWNRLIKQAMAWRLATQASGTVFSHLIGLRNILRFFGESPFQRMFVSTIAEYRGYWNTELLPKMNSNDAYALKAVLLFCCEMSIGCFEPGFRDFVGAFYYPPRDKFAAVRSGDCFLSADEESAIVNYLDDVSTRAKPSNLQIGELRDACLIVASYQHAMRPIQIAKVEREDVRVRLLNATDGPIVHVRFFKEKQKLDEKRTAMLRPIKREWAILYVRLAELRDASPDLFANERAVLNSFFGLDPYAVGLRIIEICRDLMGHSRSATDLRHTGAQRMADGGASAEELAEYLGHSDIDTGNIYFTASTTQAELLNKALAISPIYTAVERAHRTKTIDKAALLQLAPDNQIGAVVHGVPIAGIGACNLGQGRCTKNPALSCYDCRKFIPVNDPAPHREVRDTLRPVVREFYDASRGETQGPAYTQLRRTLEAVEEVIVAVTEVPDAKK